MKVHLEPMKQNAYSEEVPGPQNALDIFAGEWASKLPPPFDGLTAGQALLFDDQRLAWAIGQIGGVAGSRVLELGPLEGGHTYMLDRAGASEVLAIEANTRAYLRCLVAKELVGMHAGRFVFGDFMAYLRERPERFDVVLASGVLYHLDGPVELIARIAGITDAAYFWTHYYDEALFKSRPKNAKRVVTPAPAEYGGYRHVVCRSEYKTAVTVPGFCGGTRSHSNWLTRDGILGALRHFGLGDIQIAYEQTDHPHGPAFSILARRQSR